MKEIQREGFNKKEAAQYLGLFENTLGKLLKDGRVRFVRVGSRVLIAKSELDRFLVGDVVI